jgi:hypothetical protein
MSSRRIESGGRYPVLRSLGILYLAAAVFAVAFGIMLAGWVLYRPPLMMGNRFMLCCGVLVGTFFVVLSLLAIAEVIKLAIDIEHNTRMARGQSTPMTSQEQPNGGRLGKLLQGEETAEAALIRGH